MNLSLIGALPEQIESQLDEGLARCCAFNKRGTLLAVGCDDGRVVIWDFETLCIVKMLIGHVHPVTSVSWSRNSKKLLTSATDWNLRLWDVLSSNFDQTVKFESPLLHSEMHPRDKNECIVSVWNEPSYVVNLTTGERKPLPRNPAFAYDDKDKSVSALNSYPIYSTRGDKIYVGDSNGVVTIIRSADLTIEHSFVTQVGQSIRSISLRKDEKQILVSCSDKFIRLYDLKDFTVGFELNDPINRFHWKKAIFTPDGDSVIGASSWKHEHQIYIWQFGQLAKILKGPNDGMMDLVWHPKSPIICTCSVSGAVYVWKTQQTEIWSAFAPGFIELEENEEYIEREDEFDVIDQQELEKRKADKIKAEMQSEEVEVDVVTIDPNDFSSGEDEELFFLPTFPIPDELMAEEPTNGDQAQAKVEAAAGEAPGPRAGRGRRKGPPKAAATASPSTAATVTTLPVGDVPMQ